MDKNCCTGKGNWKLIMFMVLMVGMMVLRFRGAELGLGSYLPFMIFLICPLMHIGMLVFMFKGNKNKNEAQEVEQI